MKRLHIALMAFYNILFNRTHIYASPVHRTVSATRTEVIEMQNEIIRMCNDDIIQTNLINEVKSILKESDI